MMEKALAANGHRGMSIDVTIVMPDRPEAAAETEEKKMTEAKQLEIEEPIVAKLHDLVGGALEGREDE